MAIEWRSALSVGNEKIDDDHKALIQIINEVEQALAPEKGTAEVMASISRLVEYTKRHFAWEEDQMIRHRYAKYDAHKRAHGELIDQLENAASPIRQHHDLGVLVGTLPQAVRDEFAALLRHWLVDHIIKEDMLLKGVFSPTLKHLA